MTLPVIAEKLSRTEAGTAINARDVTPDASGAFGDLLSEVRERTPADRDDDRDSLPAGAEALAQPPAHVTVTARPSASEATDPGEPGGIQADGTVGDNGLAISGAADESSVMNPADFAATLVALNTAALPGDLPQVAQAPLPETADPAAIGAPVVNTPATSTSALATPEWSITPPAQSAAFAPALGQSIQWMVKEQLQVARLQLNPEILGPVEVRITVTGDRTDIQFAVSGPEARAAIQDALPQLRIALDNAGLALGQASVSDEPGRQYARFALAPAQSRDGQTGTDQGTVQALPRTQGLVDLYA